MHIFSLKAPAGSGHGGGNGGGGANGTGAGDASPSGYGIMGLATLSRIPRYFGSQWSSCKISLPPSRPYICAFGADINTLIGEYAPTGESKHPPGRSVDNLYRFCCCCCLAFPVICADGQFLKYTYNIKGEYNRDVCMQFLDLAEDNPAEVH